MSKQPENYFIETLRFLANLYYGEKNKPSAISCNFPDVVDALNDYDRMKAALETIALAGESGPLGIADFQSIKRVARGALPVAPIPDAPRQSVFTGAR